MKSISEKGYDVNSPASATKLPNGDLIITGGHHRIEAMNRLSENTIPVKVYDYSNTEPFQLAKFLGIGKTTGKYSGDYIPSLTSTERTDVNNYLKAWRDNNISQVKNIYEYIDIVDGIDDFRKSVEKWKFGKNELTWDKYYANLLENHPYDYEKMIEEAIRNNPNGLTKSEAYSIFSTTTIFHQVKLNQLLRPGQVTDKTQEVIKLLDKALAKMKTV